MSSYTWVAEVPVAAGRRFRGWSTDVGRWLRADVRDVVRVDPDDRSAAAAAPQALIPGLVRWRARLDRYRAAALVSRWLLVALGVGVAVEAVGLAAGASTTARAVALAAPALVWLAGVAFGLRRGRPGLEDVARLLDRDLALAEVVSTALELEQRPSADRGQPVEDGLPVLVLAEGSAAVGRSLGSGRVAVQSWWPEWVASLVLAGVVALLVTLPWSGSGPVTSGGAGRHRGAVFAGGRGERSTQTAAGSTQTAGGSAVPRHSASSSRAAPPSASTAVRPRAGNGNGAVPAPAGVPLARGRSAGKATAGSISQRPAGLGARSVASGRLSGAAAAATTAAGQSAAGAQAMPGSHSSVSASGASSGTRTANGLPRGASARRAAAGAASPHPGGVGAPHAQAKPGSAPSKAPGALAASPGAAGGESAGGARGTNASRPPRLASQPGHSAAGLPLQAGYAPSAGQSVTTGRGPAVTGGRGSARSATVGAGTVAAGAGGAGFRYIPPSPSVPPSLDLGPVLSYFGPFSWLLSATW